MRSPTLLALAIFVGSLGSRAYAQSPEASMAPWTTAWVVSSAVTAEARHPIPRVPMSDSQRRGLRWGAQVGIVAGLGAALLIAADDDCASYECVGEANALPFYLGVGMLGGMVIGGAVGLGIGTLVDEEGQTQPTSELRVTIRAR